jgi:DNA 3'-phosphatase
MKKVLYADLDGTLITTKSGEVFPKGLWDIEIRFNVLEAIKAIHPEYVFIVSNQGGIEKGYMTEDGFAAKFNYIFEIVEEYTGAKCTGLFSTSTDPNDPNRKPNVGLLKGLEHFWKNEYSKKDCLMIGDASGKEGQFSDSDKKTAENFGIDYMDVEDFVKENSVKDIWLARDLDGSLFAFLEEPVRDKDVERFMPSKDCKDVFDFNTGESFDDNTYVELPSHFYPKVTWENSPKKLILE